MCGELPGEAGGWGCRQRFIPACAGNSHARHHRREHQRGSSPRVRGTHTRKAQAKLDGRFIPACAGNSTNCASMAGMKSVHPRVCGELVHAHHHHRQTAGSSPRVRGTRCCSSAATQPTPVHPRVCGELKHVAYCYSRYIGSSPRVRGTPVCRATRTCFDRFIPACAGNSHSQASRTPLPAVHPRVCGELPQARQVHGGLRRFIPACAGNSIHGYFRVGESTVHPRVCGELPRRQPSAAALRRFIPACAGNSRLQAVQGVKLFGSSPRVRGTPAWAQVRVGETRFIPACAGNSLR